MRRSPSSFRVFIQPPGCCRVVLAPSNVEARARLALLRGRVATNCRATAGSKSENFACAFHVSCNSPQKFLSSSPEEDFCGNRGTPPPHPTFPRRRRSSFYPCVLLTFSRGIVISPAVVASLAPLAQNILRMNHAPFFAGILAGWQSFRRGKECVYAENVLHDTFPRCSTLLWSDLFA